ncbi:MAG: hypothetical protein AB7L94_40110, partial [Kofleriaceae bacterium]
SNPSGEVATIMVPNCGAITVIWRHELAQTVLHVQAGDELYMAPRSLPASEQAVVSVIVDAPPPPDTSGLLVSSGCGYGYNDAEHPTQYEVNWFSSCGERTTFLVQPREPLTGEVDPTFYAVLEDVGRTDAIQNPLHVSSWSSIASGHQLSIQMPVAAKLHTSGSSVAYSHAYPGRTTSSTTGGIAHELDVVFPEFGSGHRISVGYEEVDDVASGAWAQSFDGRLSPVRTVDLTGALLPSIRSAAASADQHRPTLSWTVDSSDNVEDVAIVRTYGISAAGGSVEWRFAVPPGQREIVVPEMPSDLEVSFFAPDVSVSLFETSDVPDYAAARSDFTRFFLGGHLSFPPGHVWRTSKRGPHAF